ncbi:MAG TPA: 4a-hydroxytetrahydrobiopterin dehydratase [Gammaproteobacteria bacterium]|nr:4a-hydroxytetrahydrobiopterin dehydratase [Gammaproteobacteria bacterium]
MTNLTQKSCKPCEGGVPPLGKEEIQTLLKQIPAWKVDSTGVRSIERLFEFKNHYHTMAFVNAVAFISHKENHHPDLEVGYNKCLVRYRTHAINGLSENDFICAAKVDVLL